MQEKEESGLRAEVERLTSELAEATTEKEAALVSSTESAGSRSRPTSSSATARPVSSENNRASADKARSQRESIDKKLADLISSGDGIQPDGARELIAELQALLQARDAELETVRESELELTQQLEVLQPQLDNLQRSHEALEAARAASRASRSARSSRANSAGGGDGGTETPEIDPDTALVLHDLREENGAIKSELADEVAADRELRQASRDVLNMLPLELREALATDFEPGEADGAPAKQLNRGQTVLRDILLSEEVESASAAHTSSPGDAKKPAMLAVESALKSWRARTMSRGRSRASSPFANDDDDESEDRLQHELDEMQQKLEAAEAKLEEAKNPNLEKLQAELEENMNARTALTGEVANLQRQVAENQSAYKKVDKHLRKAIKTGESSDAEFWTAVEDELSFVMKLLGGQEAKRSNKLQQKVKAMSNARRLSSRRTSGPDMAAIADLQADQEAIGDEKQDGDEHDDEVDTSARVSAPPSADGARDSNEPPANAQLEAAMKQASEQLKDMTSQFEAASARATNLEKQLEAAFARAAGLENQIATDTEAHAAEVARLEERIRECEEQAVANKAADQQLEDSAGQGAEAAAVDEGGKTQTEEPPAKEGAAVPVVQEAVAIEPAAAEDIAQVSQVQTSAAPADDGAMNEAAMKQASEQLKEMTSQFEAASARAADLENQLKAAHARAADLENQIATDAAAHADVPAAEVADATVNNATPAVPVEPAAETAPADALASAPAPSESADEPLPAEVTAADGATPHAGAANGSSPEATIADETAHDPTPVPVKPVDEAPAVDESEPAPVGEGDEITPAATSPDEAPPAVDETEPAPAGEAEEITPAATAVTTEPSTATLADTPSPPPVAEADPGHGAAEEGALRTEIEQLKSELAKSNAQLADVNAQLEYATKAEAERKALDDKLEALRSGDDGDAAEASKAVIAEQQALLQARDAEIKQLHETELERRRDLEAREAEVKRLHEVELQKQRELEAREAEVKRLHEVELQNQRELEARDTEVKRLHEVELQKQRELDELRPELEDLRRRQESLKSVEKESDGQSQNTPAPEADDTKPLAVSESATAADQGEAAELEKEGHALRTEIERLKSELAETKVQLQAAKAQASESGAADRENVTPSTETAVLDAASAPIAAAAEDEQRRALEEKAKAAASEAEAQRKALEEKLSALSDGEDAVQAAKTIIAQQQAMLEERNAEVERMHDLQIAAASARDAELEIMREKQREFEALRPELEDLRRRCDPAVTGNTSQGVVPATEEKALLTEIAQLKSELAQSNAQLEATAHGKDEKQPDAGDEATASKAIIAEQQTQLQARDAEVKRLHESELEKQRELEVLRPELEDLRRRRETLEQALKEAEAQSQQGAAKGADDNFSDEEEDAAEEEVEVEDPNYNAESDPALQAELGVAMQSIDENPDHPMVGIVTALAHLAILEDEFDAKAHRSLKASRQAEAVRAQVLELRPALEEMPPDVDACAGLLSLCRSQFVKYKALTAWSGAMGGGGVNDANQKRLMVLGAKVKVLTEEVERLGGWRASLFLDDGEVRTDADVSMWSEREQVLMLNEIRRALDEKADEADEEVREAREDYEAKKRELTEAKNRLRATEKKMEVLISAGGGGGGDGRMMMNTYKVLGDGSDAPTRDSIDRLRTRTRRLAAALRREREAGARLHVQVAKNTGEIERLLEADSAKAAANAASGSGDSPTAEAKGSRLLGEATRLLDATLAEAKVAAGELKEAAEEGYKEPADWFVAGANIEEGNDELERAYASDGARVEKVVARLAADLQERGSAQAANLERLQREIDVLVAAQLRMKREVSELRADYSSKDAADVIAALRARLAALRNEADAHARGEAEQRTAAQRTTKGDLERLEATVREYAGVAEVEAALEPRLADVDAELAHEQAKGERVKRHGASEAHRAELKRLRKTRDALAHRLTHARAELKCTKQSMLALYERVDRATQYIFNGSTYKSLLVWAHELERDGPDSPHRGGGGGVFGGDDASHASHASLGSIATDRSFPYHPPPVHSLLNSSLAHKASQKAGGAALPPLPMRPVAPEVAGVPSSAFSGPDASTDEMIASVTPELRRVLRATKPPAQPEPQHLGIVHKDRGVMPIRSTYANRMQNTQLLRQKR